MSCKHGVDTTVKECATCRAADPDEKPLDVEAIRARSGRRLIHAGHSLVRDFLTADVPALCDEVTRLRAELRAAIDLGVKDWEAEHVLRQTAERDLAAARRELEEARRWKDAPLPEDEAISKAHPVHSGRHDAYAEAMRLVGARHSKGALVSLVNWLLVERDAAQARVGVLREALVTARNCIAFDGSLGPEEDSAIANKALRAIDIALEKAREAEKAGKR